MTIGFFWVRKFRLITPCKNQTTIKMSARIWLGRTVMPATSYEPMRSNGRKKVITSSARNGER